MCETKSSIKEEWEEYYKVLEGIRRTGVCNMFGSAPLLTEFCPELDVNQARKVVSSWMANYGELSQKYDWND